MALIKCPECGKEISDTSYKCTNCGFVIKKPKRGVVGSIFKTLFMLLNIIMFILIASTIYTMSQSGGETGVNATVGVVGFGTIFIAWVVFGLPLGIMSYITRAKID